VHTLGPLESGALDRKVHGMVTVGLATSVRFGLQPPEGIDSDALVTEAGHMLALWIRSPL
jgi:hypothetical protein